MNQSLQDYFRCPSEFSAIDVSPNLRKGQGFFAFGPDLRVFGRSEVEVSPTASDTLQDAAPKVHTNGNTVQLPFDLSDLTANFQHERYMCPDSGSSTWKVVTNSYYGVRPILPTALRKYLQKLYFRGWRNIKFPKWPIDDSVDRLYKEVMACVIRSRGCEIPFIWFWPESHLSCCILTHDVEQQAGLNSCLDLLKIDRDRGFKSSFQLVPEQRYVVTPELREKIRSEGFEVNVHDINHDGHLFRTHEEFRSRAERINDYGQRWGAEGFRAGSMYRNLAWVTELNFSYDMSVPNAAHLEPQRGGCCTVMPFHAGSLIELPLTMTQDYSLYNILGWHSTELWRNELDTIVNSNGLISFNVHPDYVLPREGREVYLALLEVLSDLLPAKRVWQPLPKEAAEWWRQRSHLELVKQGNEWRITGDGAARACLAFAYLRDGQVHYRLSSTASAAGARFSH